MQEKKQAPANNTNVIVAPQDEYTDEEENYLKVKAFDKPSRTQMR